MFVQEKDLVLFQGDSITDAERDRTDYYSLSEGYVGQTERLFSSRHPQMEVVFLNRGVGGDRSADMLARWKEDCLDLNPTVVSVLIGVNDTWRRYDANLFTSAQQYRQNIREAFRSVKERGMRLIVLTPFLLPAPDKEHWRKEDLDEKIDVCLEEAAQYADITIPLDALFRKALEQDPSIRFSEDGVHPNLRGAQFIAQQWVEAIEQA